MIGEDANREGLIKTPDRVAKALLYLTKGYHQNPEEILKSALFKENYRQMVIVKDIDLFSLCEHHMLPFFGKAHVAYISNGKVIGLSKLNRIVQYFAKRPQVQERMTVQIAQELKKALGTEDIAVIIEAKHLCVSSRGVQDDTSTTVTSHYDGAFKNTDKINELHNYIFKNSTSC